MENTRVFVAAGGKGSRLYPLTKERAKPAVPFAGGSRIVDCALASCMYSGLRRVNVLVYYMPHSLTRYIQGKWNIARPGLNEFIYADGIQTREAGEHSLGDADAVRKNLYLLDEGHDRYLLVLSGDHVYKMNFRQMMDYHRDTKSRLTVSAFETAPENAANSLGVIEADTDGRITGFQEKPEKPKAIPGKDACLASMGIYLFDVDFLREVLTEETHGFGTHVIPSVIGGDVYAYNFSQLNSISDYVLQFKGGRRSREYVDRTGDSTYFRDVGNPDALWQANMDLVGVDPLFNLYTENWTLGGRPPAKLVERELLVCEGGILNSDDVHRSVISPGVIIERGARVTDSILFDDAWVGEGAKVSNAIIDKKVEIPPETIIDGRDLEPLGLKRGEDYRVTENGITVIARSVKITSHD